VPLLPQTRRHALLAHLLRVPSIVFAVNKLDAVDAPARGLRRGARALQAFAAGGRHRVAGIVPVSALRGDNVTSRWPRLVRRPSLLQLLESLPTAQERSDGDLLAAGAVRGPRRRRRRPPAACAVGPHRPGRVKAGDAVQVFPSGEPPRWPKVRAPPARWTRAAGRAVAGLVLDRQLDVSRGDWIWSPPAPAGDARFSATLAWLDTEPAVIGRKYWLRHGNRWVQARIAPSTPCWTSTRCSPIDAHELAVNEIGQVRSSCSSPAAGALRQTNRVGGALIVVDPASHRTSGALLVAAPAARTRGCSVPSRAVRMGRSSSSAPAPARPT
jgi:sulfate adenylyltransferase subunit 1